MAGSEGKGLNLTPSQAKRKDAQLRKTYGITLEEFTAILDYQGWQCPICGKDYEHGKLWALDHEHRDGLEGPVRGIVCYACNRYKVGNLKAREAEKIWLYLSKPPAYSVLGGERIASPPKRRRRRQNRSNAKSGGTLRKPRKPK